MTIDDYEDITLTVTRGIEYATTVCWCGKTFQGRDPRRVNQHATYHVNRCSHGRRGKRIAAKSNREFLARQIEWGVPMPLAAWSQVAYLR